MDNFNPHFPWGKWPVGMILCITIYWFQPTLPVREVTVSIKDKMSLIIISTHTSREGSDTKLNNYHAALTDFNPHFPWGKWLFLYLQKYYNCLFQPTLPVREVTNVIKLMTGVPLISTHTSREGSDLMDTVSVRVNKNFNPHFPWGKWLRKSTQPIKIFIFQPTLPVREVTW